MTSIPFAQYDFSGRRILHPDQPVDRMVIEEICLGYAYPLNWLGSFQPSTILDVGAGVGAAALYFHKYFPEAKIHCYEPDVRSFNLLNQNVTGISAVTLHPFGLYRENAEMPLYDGTDGPSGNTLFTDSPRSHQTVSVRRASEAVAELGIDQISILKLNTSGAEPFILLDLFSEASAKLPIAAIFVAHHADEHKKWVDDFLSQDYEAFQVYAPLPNRYTKLYVLKEILPFLATENLRKH